jgi:hypothetical protein
MYTIILTAAPLDGAGLIVNTKSSPSLVNVCAVLIPSTTTMASLNGSAAPTFDILNCVVVPLPTKFCTCSISGPAFVVTTDVTILPAAGATVNTMFTAIINDPTLIE